MKAAPDPVLQPATARRRPFGVFAIVALQLLDIMTLSVQALVAWRGLQGLHLPSFGDLRVIAAVNGVIITLLLINIAGLLRLQRWAWLLTMILTGASLLLRIVSYFWGAAPAFPLLVGVLTVFYLNQRTVQQRFKRRDAGTKAGV